jgi:type II secretory pathway component PulM
MATKSPGERRTVAALVLAVAAAVLWAALWVPLARDTAALKLARTTNAAALAEARDRAKEASELSRVAAAAPKLDPRAELDRALTQLGVRPAVTSLDWRDGRAQLVFAAISYDRVINLLDALQRDAKLRAVEATLTARVEPGIVRAELTLAR